MNLSKNTYENPSHYTIRRRLYPAGAFVLCQQAEPGECAARSEDIVGQD
jgi:hypothetical protein